MIITKHFADRGFGFIEYNVGEIYFRKNQVKGTDISEGTKVLFTLGQGNRRPEVRNIKILDNATNKGDRKPNERYLPKDTADLIDYSKIDNFNLKLNKVAQSDGDGFKLFKVEKGKIKFWVNPDFSKINFEAIA
ncbi:MAG: cold-shock protein, partial [Mahellales bacterium]